jgi:hypothetical protein
MVTGNKKKEAELRNVLAKAKIGKKVLQASRKKHSSLQSSSAEAAAATAAKRKAARRNLTAKDQVKARSSSKSSVMEAPPTATGGSNLEPPFSYEVHHKNKTITVFVTLHKVPPASINVDSTTTSTLVVHTETFSKKWRLVFPFPEGLLVLCDKAEYEYEDGILRCVFPIKGDIPASIVEQREKLFSSFKATKSLRFKTTKEGGNLVVRSRRAAMTVPSGADATAGERKREKMKTITATNEQPKTANTGSRNKQAPLQSALAASAASPRQRAAAPNKEERSSKPKMKPALVDDGAAMVSIADAAGKASRNKFAERLMREKEILKRRTEALGKKAVKDSTKKDRQQFAFERIVAEQKAQLQQQIALAAKPKRQPQAKNAGKTVRFTST